MLVKKVKNFYPGMGQAVAERTILRKIKDKWENWADVSERVAKGNSLLCKDKSEQNQEYLTLKYHLEKATTLMSGRHLQHGDETQPTRNQEIFTNCATACTSFSLFYLLMNGSGVGRCYDDDMMLVNFDNSPTVRCVLDEIHPDFDISAHESVRDAKHKYGSGHDVLWVQVQDTREGWAKAVEVWENACFEKIHRDKMLILDFSKVRCKGTPIQGMQNRPASGPVPLMNAFNKSHTLKGAGLPRWMQTMYVDHYFAECVLVGGARRAARMATKTWRDTTVLQFITIKRPIEYYDKSVEEIQSLQKELFIAGKDKPYGFLWSSNNSITVDEEFWRLLGIKKGSDDYEQPLAQQARSVFKLTTAAAYGDGTGEPGFINQDKLNCDKSGLENLLTSDGYLSSKKYRPEDDTQLYMKKVLKTASKKRFFMIVNPCVTKDTWVTTSSGPRQVSDLIGHKFDAVVDGKSYNSDGFWLTGIKPIFEVKTDRGYSIRLTKNHKLFVERRRKQILHGYSVVKEWVEVQNLKKGDRLVFCNQRENTWDGQGSFEEGWLIGEMVGDGGYNPESYSGYVRFWGENQEIMADYAVQCLKQTGMFTRSNFVGHSKNITNNNTTTVCAALNKIANGLIEPITKKLLESIEITSSDFYRGFLRGLFDADGTVSCNNKKGRSVRLSQSNIDRIQVVQRMLARLGIISTIYPNRHKARFRKMPDGQGGERLYWCEANHELVISKDNIKVFNDIIGFTDPDKQRKISSAVNSIQRGVYKERFLAKITSIESAGKEEVYDCTVNDIHAFDANGFMAHNCGEIPLAVWGGFCVIGDVVPFHADTLDEAEDAFRATTRALIRANTMDSIYSMEVRRTNRIGVGITGIHEFAWKFFELGFRDLIDEKKSKDFWMALSRFKRAVKDEATKYAIKLGVTVPHTDTTIKPAGTTSKLFGLTEGWHLPTMRWYIRWVQFSKNDPLIAQYASNGYPTKELVKYQNTVIVGFPTIPLIATLCMGDLLVTAAEATPEEQYRWLMLGEKYWLRGVDEQGNPLSHDSGNQISYCLAGNKNHLIATPQGFQRIETFSGKSVLNRYGKPQEVIDIHDNGIHPVRKIILTNGFEIIGTKDHKILIVSNDLSFVWKKIDEIIPGDIVVRRVGDNNFNNNDVFLSKRKYRNGNVKNILIPSVVSEDIGLFFGMLMSDGYITDNGVGLVSIDKSVRNLFQKLLSTIFGLESIQKIDTRSGVTHIESYSRELKNWLLSLGVARYHDDNVVPDCILRSNLNILRQFIRGYTLDGYVIAKNGNCAVLCTTSNIMAKDVAAILCEMGYDVYIGHKKGRPYHFDAKNKGIGKDQYQVILPQRQVKRFILEIGFLEKYKNNAANKFHIMKRSNGKTNVLPATVFREFFRANKNKFNEATRCLLKSNCDKISLESVQKYFSHVVKEIDNLHFILSNTQLRFTAVKQCEQYGVMPTYDICVDASHEYVSNSIVVHNTLKYNPEKISFNEFRKTLRMYQSMIRCCSIMPQEDASSYEYLPEQPVTKAEYENISRSIHGILQEDIGAEHVGCQNGACPVDFKKAS